MAGANSSPRVAVEIFVKQDKVAPVWVGLELFEISKHWSAASFISEKYVRYATRQLARYFPEGHHLSRSGWELNLEVIAEIVMELLQRLDQQVVHGEPNGAAPIGVAAEQPCGRFARLIVD